MKNKSQLRYRKGLKTAIASFGERGIYVLTQLVAIPLTISYLGEERFGAWMIIFSFIAILSISDFGIQYGLQNLLSEAYGRGKTDEAKGLIANAYVIFALIGMLIMIVSLFVIPFADIQKVINIRDVSLIPELRSALYVLIFSFAISLPLSVGGVAFIAYQEGYVTNLWTIGRNIFSLCLIILIARFNLGVPWLIAAIYTFPLIFSVFVTFHLFFLRRRELRPSWQEISLQSLKNIFRRGSGFLGLQILSLFGNNLDTVIVAQVMNAASVAIYSITSRLFSPILLLQNIIIRPLWPAYGEAKVSNDWKWIRNALVLSLLIAVGLSLLLGLPLFLFGEKIIRIWTKSDLSPTIWLLGGFFLFSVSMGFKIPLVNFLNGLSRLKLQLVYQSLFTGISFCLKIWLGKKYGAEGVIFGAVIATFGVLIWLMGLESIYVIGKNLRLSYTQSLLSK